MVGLIDTNLFKKLTKNTGGIHETFVKGLGDEAAVTKWAVTHFGFLEYLGFSVPNLSSKLDPMPKGWTPPDAMLDPRIQTEDPLIREVASQLAWIRSKAKEKYAAIVTPEELDEKAVKERKYHEDPFKNGPFDIPLFEKPLATYHHDAFAELLAIDYVHRHDFPAEMRPTILWLCRGTMIQEHYDERRNVALSRSFKQSWIRRVKGPHESHISRATMANLELAMSEIDPNSDRFDLDLLVYFLLGYAVDGEYEPVTIYTQDKPKQVLSRLAVFFDLLRSTWGEWSHLDKVGPPPFQKKSRYRFVCDHGHVLKEISSDDLLRYLLAEGLLPL